MKSKEELIKEYKAQRDKYRRLADFNYGEFQRTKDDDYMCSVEYFFDRESEYMSKLKALGVDPLEDFS